MLKAAVEDLLPRQILHRAKRGFGVPLDRWFREDLHGYVAATLGAGDARVKDHLAAEAVDRLIAEHDAAAAQPRLRALDPADARGLPAARGLVIEGRGATPPSSGSR